MRTSVPVEDRFLFERRLLDGGVSGIAGVDEAGRGPLAGPVVAAAVVFPDEWIRNGLPEPLDRVNDSKQLTARMREKLFEAIRSRPEIRFAVAEAGAALIDEINILQATHQAMNLALERLRPPANHALVDGLAVPTLLLPQTPLVGGDARSYSIAAASILAKVTRDRLMESLHERFPQYGFDRHKGYGTAEHLAALKQYGPCPEHRRSFAPVRERQGELFR